MQAKLDEILRALDNAREEFVGIEHLTDNQIEAIREALEDDIQNGASKGRTAAPTVERLQPSLLVRGSTGPPKSPAKRPSA
jgi:low affinity Fe/Cu permease